MQFNSNKSRQTAAFTLAEVLIAFGVIGITVGGILAAYNSAASYAERAGYSLAAQSLAVQQLELVRAATWDTMSTPIVDNTTNIQLVTTNILDIPISGTNAVYATNTIVISNFVTGNFNPAAFKMIQVITTWPWNGGVASNVIVAYRAPDQ